MAQPFHVQQLKIVGYADSLTRDMLPTLVPPVFLTQSAQPLAVLPPFTIHEDLVFCATCLPAGELPILAAQGKITLFTTEFDAQPDFLLAIDEDNNPLYAHRSEVTATLDSIAAARTGEAQHALAAGDFATAEARCRAAISASDSLVDPLAIQAAILRLQRRESEVAVLARMALPRLTPSSFDSLVRHFAGIAAPHATHHATPTPARPMQGIATLKALAA